MPLLEVIIQKRVIKGKFVKRIKGQRGKGIRYAVAYEYHKRAHIELSRRPC